MSSKIHALTLVASVFASSALAAQVPDLKPTLIRVSSQLSPNVSASLEATIKNIGTWSSKSCNSGFYLSTNSTINSSDRLLKSYTTSGLGIGKSHNYKTSVTMPQDIPAGTCYVGIWADRNNTVTEWSNSNNTLAVKVTCNGRPNLRVSTLSASSARIRPGGDVFLNVRVQNDGGVRAGAFRTGSYLSTDARISTSDTLLRSYAHSGLAVGASIGYSHRCAIPQSAALGDCYLGVYTDDLFQVSEITSTDNQRSVSVRCYQPGSFQTYGAGCAGRAGVSKHSATNPNAAPYLGTTTTLRLENGPRNFVAVLFLGFSRTQWGSLPLPLPLDAIGAPKCQLLVSPDVTLTVGTDAAGSGAVPVKHPSDPRLLGLEFFTQFAGVELGYNALGMSFSNAVASELGQL